MSAWWGHADYPHEELIELVNAQLIHAPHKLHALALIVLIALGYPRVLMLI